MKYSDVVERFLRYVQVDSPSNPQNAHHIPSDESQFDMARVVARDLENLGLQDVRIDEHAYVLATLPASKGLEHLPALGFVCHLDTSFDAPNKGVKPHIVRYDGKRLVHGEVDGKEVVSTPANTPYLQEFVDEDIIVSDGTTLLSVDDKAAIAEVVSLVKRLLDNPNIKHPTLKLAFVPDEEIGHGASLLNLDEFGAQYAYTIDCQELGLFHYECFNAALVQVDIQGTVVHPGTAKNSLVNALEVFSEFHALIPKWQKPEYTSGYEGFFHLSEVTGNNHQVHATYIIRDFDDEAFAFKKDVMYSAQNLLNNQYGQDTVRVSVQDQYLNMARGFVGKEFILDNALEAYHAVGITPRILPFRGGTDGAQLTLRGLPCPNLATGGYNFHSTREFIAVSALEKTVDMLEMLVGLYARDADNPA